MQILGGLRDKIDTLELTDDEIKAELKALGLTDEQTEATLASLQTQIDANRTQIDENSEMIVDLAEIANSELWLENNIDADELDLVKGEDLMQKDADGNPEYLIAKGRTDGDYHVYKHNRNYSNNSRAQYRSVSNIAGDRLKSGSNYLYLSVDDAKKDADGSLEDRSENSINNEDWGYIKVSGNYSTGSPLVLDTNGNGQIEAASGMGVDVNNDGKADGAGVNGDKMLAMDDLNGNGKIDGAEVFGNETVNAFTGEKMNAENGFEALKILAESAEANSGNDVIDDKGIVNLELLKDALAGIGVNLGLIGDNNVTELEGLGDVASIGTSFKELPETDGTALHLQEGSLFTKDGEERLVHDVWFNLD